MSVTAPGSCCTGTLSLFSCRMHAPALDTGMLLLCSSKGKEAPDGAAIWAPPGTLVFSAREQRFCFKHSIQKTVFTAICRLRRAAPSIRIRYELLLKGWLMTKNRMLPLKEDVPPKWVNVIQLTIFQCITQVQHGSTREGKEQPKSCSVGWHLPRNSSQVQALWDIIL